MGLDKVDTSGSGNHLPSPWSDLAVVRASISDAVAVLTLRDDLAAWMVSQGISQWQPGEISLGRIETLISDGSVYAVQRDHELIASVTITWADRFIWGERSEAA